MRNRHDAHERHQNLARYGRRLDEDVVRNGPITRALNELARRVADGESLCLQCHCAPDACHADMLADEIRRRAGKFRAAKIAAESA